jgi:Response regulator containing a CheY-like receiver domain and an HD-GYP domain
MSKNVRSSINRLMRIASLHDPSETGPHAERVGAIAAELYQEWAEARGEAEEDIRYYKGQLRLAAMLHDIGKVGVSDLILKKPGALTDEERAIMRTHTYLGSTLFAQDTGDISELAMDTTLHHHQKWDGTGYSGHSGTPVLAGENIPLAARITALADVFDALVSKRCYKEMWSFDEARARLREESGRHFDPELIDCFFEITDLITSIYERFPDD